MPPAPLIAVEVTAIVLGAQLGVYRFKDQPLPQSSFQTEVADILSLVGDGVVSVDCQGLIVLFNRSAEELFGYASAEVLSHPLEMLLPKRFKNRHELEVADYISAEASGHRSMGGDREVVGLHKTGREFAIEATLSTHMLAGQPIFTAVVRDITERRTLDQKLKLISGEVAHRLRNTMSVVSAVVSMTARTTTSVPDFATALLSRLAAVSRTNDALIAGSANCAGLRAVLMSELAAYQGIDRRVSLAGPDVQIDGSLALDLGLIFHELATNAVKYGGLSSSDGALEVSWLLTPDDPATLELVWRERGGPVVSAPLRQGFGSRLISRILAGRGGLTNMSYEPSGVICTVSAPMQ